MVCRLPSALPRCCSPPAAAFNLCRIMDNLGVADAATLFITPAKNIPRAKFVQLKPRVAGFQAAAVDVKAQLEYSLRSFTVLTVGDVVPVTVAGQRMPLEVTDVKPFNKANVRCHLALPSGCLARVMCVTLRV